MLARDFAPLLVAGCEKMKMTLEPRHNLEFEDAARVRDEIKKIKEQTDALLRWGPLAGALLFAFSDMLIGINRFTRPLPGAAFAIILTYWTAQALFATTALRANAAAPRLDWASRSP